MDVTNVKVKKNCVIKWQRFINGQHFAYIHIVFTAQCRKPIVSYNKSNGSWYLAISRIKSLKIVFSLHKWSKFHVNI